MPIVHLNPSKATKQKARSIYLAGERPPTQTVERQLRTLLLCENGIRVSPDAQRPCCSARDIGLACLLIEHQSISVFRRRLSESGDY
jgi:hypothetical protein